MTSGPLNYRGLSRNVQEFPFRYSHTILLNLTISLHNLCGCGCGCGYLWSMEHSHACKARFTVTGARAHVMKRTNLGEVVLYRLRVAFLHWGGLRAELTYLKRYGWKLACAFASVRASTTIIFRVRGGIKPGLACNEHFRKYNSRAASTSILFL